MNSLLYDLCCCSHKLSITDKRTNNQRSVCTQHPVLKNEAKVLKATVHQMSVWDWLLKDQEPHKHQAENRLLQHLLLCFFLIISLVQKTAYVWIINFTMGTCCMGAEADIKNASLTNQMHSLHDWQVWHPIAVIKEAQRLPLKSAFSIWPPPTINHTVYVIQSMVVLCLHVHV